MVVKHTGAQVGNGDELNGITFGGVGGNTIVKNLQMYSTYDDGIEMFDGAVNKKTMRRYMRDDSMILMRATSEPLPTPWSFNQQRTVITALRPMVLVPTRQDQYRH